MNDPKHKLEARTNAELDIEDSLNVVEWLTEHFKDFGCTLQLITNKSSEGFQFCKGFTGLGGFLRYKVELEYIVGSNKEAWNDEDDDFI
jgi:peptide chain release factor subunit 1